MLYVCFKLVLGVEFIFQNTKINHWMFQKITIIIIIMNIFFFLNLKMQILAWGLRIILHIQCCGLDAFIPVLLCANKHYLKSLTHALYLSGFSIQPNFPSIYICILLRKQKQATQRWHNAEALMKTDPIVNFALTEGPMGNCVNATSLFS